MLRERLDKPNSQDNENKFKTSLHKLSQHAPDIANLKRNQEIENRK